MYGCAIGTMENLLVFYGNVVRDEFFGVDVSSCDSMKVVVTDMVNRAFADVRRCIRARFGPGMRGKKMIVEALVVVGGMMGHLPVGVCGRSKVIQIGVRT